MEMVSNIIIISPIRRGVKSHKVFVGGGGREGGRQAGSVAVGNEIRASAFYNSLKIDSLNRTETLTAAAAAVRDSLKKFFLPSSTYTERPAICLCLLSLSVWVHTTRTGLPSQQFHLFWP